MLFDPHLLRGRSRRLWFQIIRTLSEFRNHSSVAFIFFLCLSCGFRETSAQIFRMGECPSHETPHDFNMNRFMGKYYVVERYYTPFGGMGLCWTETFLEEDNNLYAYDAFDDSIFGRRHFLKFMLFPPDHHTPDFPYSLTSLPILRLGNFRILDTDYDNWALAWDCRNTPLFGRFEVVYILGRRPQLEAEYVTQAKKVAKKFDIDVQPLIPWNTGCGLKMGVPYDNILFTEDDAHQLILQQQEEGGDPRKEGTTEISNHLDEDKGLEDKTRRYLCGGGSRPTHSEVRFGTVLRPLFVSPSSSTIRSASGGCDPIRIPLHQTVSIDPNDPYHWLPIFGIAGWHGKFHPSVQITKNNPLVLPKEFVGEFRQDLEKRQLKFKPKQPYSTKPSIQPASLSMERTSNCTNEKRNILCVPGIGKLTGRISMFVIDVGMYRVVDAFPVDRCHGFTIANCIQPEGQGEPLGQLLK
ncbi:unnamed protein product [Cyprideis torosa]|uniref:Uncharacterized protein n=1 Tax=Cyprideis torosa TaxID=163714 RepID=A0A7R8W4Q0_9CRUS|nr:unnamed protein product [Cyprideis torosa]CAG0884428.1 unnamed protein product [Cyprideis torosa]